MRPRLIALGLACLAALAVVAAVALKDGPAGARARIGERRPHLTPKELPSLACPDDVASCRSVRGRVLYAEKVDPDGDGDLHVVLISRDSVTAPGITVVDVAPRLRPREDPGIGDSVVAAGPVDVGTHGQRQLAALRYSQRK